MREDDQILELSSLARDFSPAVAHAALSRPHDTPPATPIESLATFVCAARELFEEAGVLFARSLLRGSDVGAELGGERGIEMRRHVQAGLPLAQAAAELGLVLALDDLTYYSHWITPEAMPQRFDTRFFLAVLPEGQLPSPDRIEVLEGLWITVEEALERSKAGFLPLHFATVSHLRRLAPYRTLEDLLAFGRTKSILPVMPLTRDQGGRPVPFLPEELDGVW